MRLLIIVGALTAMVGIERPAEAQNGAWCLYQDGDGDGSPQCRYGNIATMLG